MVFTSAVATEIVINAPPERVWKTLTNFKEFPRWNPFIVSLEPQKEFAPGNPFKATMKLPGKKPNTLTPKFLKTIPNEELRWKGSIPIPGLFYGEHYFVLEPLASGQQTKMVHGENFSGLLVPLLGGMLTQVKGCFEDMNNTLKQEVEK